MCPFNLVEGMLRSSKPVSNEFFVRLCLAYSNLLMGRGVRSQRVSQREQKSAKREPKGAKGIPKGAKWEPNGSQMRAKGRQKDAKGSKGNPKATLCGTGTKK